MRSQVIASQNVQVRMRHRLVCGRTRVHHVSVSGIEDSGSRCDEVGSAQQGRDLVRVSRKLVQRRMVASADHEQVYRGALFQWMEHHGVFAFELDRRRVDRTTERTLSLEDSAHCG